MSLVKNSILNLAGFGIPTLIAIPSLAILARQLGTELFGLFTLAFAIVGYASIFDAGLTRAVIREISIFRNDFEEQKKIIATATFSVFCLGVLAAIIIYFFSTPLTDFLNVSEKNTEDAKKAFDVLAFAVPVFLLNQIWLAYLEGHEKFASLNLQRIIGSSAIAAIPAILVCFSHSLSYAVFGLLLGRLISLALSFFFSREIILNNKKISKITLFRLIKFGGWITISNLISPIMVYFDRFIISHVLGATKIAYYTAPSEAISRLLNIPYALSRALFPKLSSKTEQNKAKLEKLSYCLLLACCLPLVIIGVIFSQQILVLWLGKDYQGMPSDIFRILLVGFLFNSLAQIPFSKIQAAGKAHITAFLHMIEVLPYLILLYFLTIHMSLIGTALAWTLRVFIDFIALYYFSRESNVKD